MPQGSERSDEGSECNNEVSSAKSAARGAGDATSLVMLHRMVDGLRLRRRQLELRCVDESGRVVGGVIE